MIHNFLNQTVILSGLLMIKASGKDKIVEDNDIEIRFEDNIIAYSNIFSFRDSTQMQFLKRVFNNFQKLITPGPIPMDSDTPLDISDDSKTELSKMVPKDDVLTTFIKDYDNKLLEISKKVEAWLKELLITAFFDKRLLTAEARKKAIEDGSLTSENIKNEAICSYIFSTKYSNGILMHLCNSILSRFKAIGADSERVIPKIEACLKTIIETLGEATEMASIYFSRTNNPNWEKYVEILWKEKMERKERMEALQREKLEASRKKSMGLPSYIAYPERIIRWFNLSRLWASSPVQSVPEELPKTYDEAFICDIHRLEKLKNELDILYSEKIMPAINELVSYYHLFLYVSINNAIEKRLNDKDTIKNRDLRGFIGTSSGVSLSNEDEARYYDLREFIKSLDDISLLLCGIPEIIQRSDVNLKSHILRNSDLYIFRKLPREDFRSYIKKLHKETGGNTLYIDLSKALEKFEDFKDIYTKDLIIFENSMTSWPGSGPYGYSSFINHLANHLLYITYDVTEEMLNEKEDSQNPVQNANQVGNGD